MNRSKPCTLVVIAGAALTMGLASCGIFFGPPLTGDPVAGATFFVDVCSRCHSAAFVKPFADLITFNMGDVNPAMTGIVLTDQEIADLKAYLATVP